MLALPAAEIGWGVRGERNEGRKNMSDEQEAEPEKQETTGKIDISIPRPSGTVSLNHSIEGNHVRLSNNETEKNED